MRQEQKDRGVSTSRFILLATLCLLLIFSRATAQKAEFEFQKNFIRNLKYPKELKNGCIPTLANILVKISEKGLLNEILISDSAPKSFAEQFNIIKSKLDLSLLNSTISANKLKRCDIIIPVFYLYEDNYCSPSTDQMSFINDNYFVFNGKPLNNVSFNLKPIIVRLYKPRE